MSEDWRLFASEQWRPDDHLRMSRPWVPPGASTEDMLSVYAQWRRFDLLCAAEDLEGRLVLSNAWAVADSGFNEAAGVFVRTNVIVLVAYMRITGAVLWRDRGSVGVQIPVNSVGAQWEQLSPEERSAYFVGVSPSLWFPYGQDGTWDVFLDQLEERGVRQWLEDNGVCALHGQPSTEANGAAELDPWVVRLTS